MKKVIFLLCAAVITHSLYKRSKSNDSFAVEDDKGVVGTLIQYSDFPSMFIDPIHVNVWLPPGYGSDTAKHYPVVYMHDGQNLFDPTMSFIGVDWGVDEAMTRLIANRKVRPAIIVGVWNSPNRVAEYCPQKPMERYIAANKIKGQQFKLEHGEPDADNYLEFLVNELKPYIDQEFRTLPGQKDTFTMGSSMGGLISAYALCEYPDVFGGAGCVSTHWPIGEGMFIDYLADHLPDADTHKIYFDFGTKTLDASYEPFQAKADEIMEAAGWTHGTNWITRKFPGHEHSERAWRQRVHIPLTFLLGRPDSGRL